MPRRIVAATARPALSAVQFLTRAPIRVDRGAIARELLETTALIAAAISVHAQALSWKRVMPCCRRLT